MLGKVLDSYIYNIIFCSQITSILQLNQPMSDQIIFGNLNDFFSQIEARQERIESMKVFVNLGNAVLPAIQNSKLICSKVELLLRIPGNSLASNNMVYKAYLKTIIEDWQRLLKIGRITTLDIRYFDFFTPDWQVIIDHKYLILGLNLPLSVKSSWKEFEILETILVERPDQESRSLVNSYSNRFDKFFSEYGTKDFDLENLIIEDIEEEPLKDFQNSVKETPEEEKKKLISHWYNLVAKAELEKVLEELISFLDEHSLFEYFQTANQLTFKLNRIKKEKTKGIMDSQELHRLENAIALSVQDLIKRISDYMFPDER